MSLSWQCNFGCLSLNPRRFGLAFSVGNISLLRMPLTPLRDLGPPWRGAVCYRFKLSLFMVSAGKLGTLGGLIFGKINDLLHGAMNLCTLFCQFRAILRCVYRTFLMPSNAWCWATFLLLIALFGFELQMGIILLSQVMLLVMRPTWPSAFTILEKKRSVLI